MSIREKLASWGIRALGWVEWLGDVLGLALAALMLPVGKAVLWLGQFLMRQARTLWHRIRPPRPDPVQAAEPELAAVPEDEDGGRGPGPTAPPQVEGQKQPRGFAWMVAALYVLAVLCWAVLTVMRRVDSALQQMEVGDASAGSALGFPVSFSNVVDSLTLTAAQESVDATREAWTLYSQDVTRTTVLRDPFEIAASLIRLDRYYILLYVVLLGVGLWTLGRLNARTPGRNRLERKQRDRRARMLSGAGGALALLLVVDLTEDWQLNHALVKGMELTVLTGDIALGPVMSLLKVPLALGVLAAGLFVAVSLAVETRPLHAAFKSVRGVAYGVALLVLILMVGIGAAQLDDVIRAWDGWRAAWAVLACLLLAVTVAGVARRLSSGAREHPRPDQGESVQPLLLGTGVVVIAAGQVLRLGGFGWGVSVAGVLFVVIWVFGLPLDGLPKWSELPRRPSGLVKLYAAVLGAAAGAALAAVLGRAVLLGVLAGAVVALAALAGWARQERDEPDRPEAEEEEPVEEEPPEEEPVEEELPEEDPVAVAFWGDRIGRVLGSVVAAALVVAAARAMALDAYVRKGPSWELIRWPLLGAAATLVVGVGVFAYRSQRVGADVKPWKSAWFPLTLLALAAGGLLLVYDNAISGPQAAGSVAVLLGGFLVFIGVLALLAEAARRGPITGYALAPALRALRFRRFPVVLFLVVWAFAVSALDAGGYHDIRRIPAAAGTSVAPTIGQAWQQYVQSGPQGAARPVVLVGAQGGGIRAAVWTALVMECIFGPGPVAGSGDICAERDTTPDPNRLAANVGQPLPVFLASGASGGSVGLAAWSARRADLVQDGPSSATPRTVEEALDRDFVAPDVARLLLADLPHALLAWDFADRAEMLEGAWEQVWHDSYPPGVDPSVRGLGRGLRRTWDLTHAGGAWATPVLAFNGISVEDGCRFLASAVDFTLPTDPADINTASTADKPNDAACRGVASSADTATAVDVLPSTSELIDYLCSTEDVPLSTAAHISARFPYVSPTGRIHRRACPSEDGLVPEPAISYDADGGIFDNSGSGTAVDSWRALAPLAVATERATGTCLVPIFLQIDNSAGRATISSAADPRPNELTAPVGATMGQVSSREAYSRSGAAAAFGRMTSAAGRQVNIGGAPAGSAWFRIVLFGQPGPEPPLGWTLAPETVKDMRSQLRAVPNQEAIGELRRLLSPGRLTCRTP